MKKITCCLLLFLLSIILLKDILGRFYNDTFIIESVIAKTDVTKEENFNIMKMIIAKATKNSNNLFNFLREKTDVVKKHLTEEKVEFNEDLIFYIYNTHQTEGYEKTKVGSERFTPTVMTAANLLKAELEKLKIGVVVEERSIKKRLNEENWPYDHSYRISREYMEDVKKNIPTLKIFIDLHRDSVDKKITTAKIGNKSYAKVMFLVGKANKNYLENEKHITKLENWLKEHYPSLLRNRFYRDYVYNQDFNDTTFLLELGSDNNTLEEITNTIEVLADMFYDWYIDNYV